MWWRFCVGSGGGLRIFAGRGGHAPCVLAVVEMMLCMLEVVEVVDCVAVGAARGGAELEWALAGGAASRALFLHQGSQGYGALCPKFSGLQEVTTSRLSRLFLCTTRFVKSHGYLIDLYSLDVKA